MSNPTLETLRWQFQLTWSLASTYHLPHLTDAACRWEPAPQSWTVRPTPSGLWQADWSDKEPEPAPTVTIGWITWQIIWWWSSLLSAVCHEPPPAPHEIPWPGSAAATRERMEALASTWLKYLGSLTDAELEHPLAYPWPDAQPLARAIAWANSELMKNIAEIGTLKHLYQAHHSPSTS